MDQSLDDKDCITRLKIALESCPDTDSYKVVNEQGNTIMHLAAIKLRPVFLANIVETLPQLNNSRNIEGFLPVEALRARLERKRTVKEVFDAVLDVSDHFKGFSSPEIKCLCLLDNTEFHDLASLSPDEIDAAWAVGQD